MSRMSIFEYEAKVKQLSRKASNLQQHEAIARANWTLAVSDGNGELEAKHRQELHNLFDQSLDGLQELLTIQRRL